MMGMNRCREVQESVRMESDISIQSMLGCFNPDEDDVDARDEEVRVLQSFRAEKRQCRSPEM